jgi:hypothetical protein
MEIEIKTVKLSQIKLNPENPRTISNADMDRLVQSLREFPEMMNIREVVVDETMTALGGNMRTLALRKMGAGECVAKIARGLTPEQKRRFVISDNGSWGQWDFDALSSLWSDLPLTEWGVDMPKHWDTPLPETSAEDHEPEKPNIIICPKCQHEFSVLKEKKK